MTGRNFERPKNHKEIIRTIYVEWSKWSLDDLIEMLLDAGEGLIDPWGEWDADGDIHVHGWWPMTEKEIAREAGVLQRAKDRKAAAAAKQKEKDRATFQRLGQKNGWL